MARSANPVGRLAGDYKCAHSLTVRAPSSGCMVGGVDQVTGGEGGDSRACCGGALTARPCSAASGIKASAAHKEAHAAEGSICRGSASLMNACQLTTGKEPDMTDGYDRPGDEPPLPPPGPSSGDPSAGAGYQPPANQPPTNGQSGGSGWAIAVGVALVIGLIVVVVVLATKSSSKQTPTITSQSLSIGHSTTVNPTTVTQQTTVTQPTTTVTTPAKTVTAPTTTTTTTATGTTSKPATTATSPSPATP